MTNIGVYKTDVKDRTEAQRIIDSIHRHFPESEASIDLEDSDKVLRVESFDGKIPKTEIQMILETFGYHIETLH